MNHFEKALDNLDACIFNGDALFDAPMRALFRDMLERWQRELVIWEEIAAESVEPRAEGSERRAEHYHVSWSAEDREYVGTCAEFPSLSWLAEDELSAFAGIRRLVMREETAAESVEPRAESVAARERFYRLRSDQDASRGGTGRVPEVHICAISKKE